MTTITTDLAQTIVEKAQQKARELNVNVCIAITDSGAHLAMFYRMEQAFIGSIDVAIAKARTSVLFPLPSDEFGQLIRDEQLTGMELTNQHLVGFSGGIPIIRNGSVIGAIGISGASTEHDKLIAQYAVTDR
ncbi:GlcG/HbpS family heme-binding protein [Sessilibacter corallicola]|uniref:GlcG/HbpS family heme-binding protein n=1 Tax=Sessilibacter corallicola TaxID=2904075 RepID=UPI001E3A1025|nr:heme-binding protein [Sessilibacter corallicola]MCE2030080.1 heme-binding protein [Sessilibacter corallicola]